MVESILSRKNYSFKEKVTLKILIFAFLTALAITLPQIVHFALGASGGAKWLPMYLPVLIGGCILGARLGILLGITAPLVSFFFTSAVTVAMPSPEMLPFITSELAIFAVIGGLFTQKISKNTLWSIPAVISAEICGRTSFIIFAACFGSKSLNASVAFSAVKGSIPGIIAQIIIIPIVIAIIKHATSSEKPND